LGQALRWSGSVQRVAEGTETAFGSLSLPVRREGLLFKKNNGLKEKYQNSRGSVTTQPQPSDRFVVPETRLNVREGSQERKKLTGSSRGSRLQLVKSAEIGGIEWSNRRVRMRKVTNCREHGMGRCNGAGGWKLVLDYQASKAFSCLIGWGQEEQAYTPALSGQYTMLLEGTIDCLQRSQ
jgi:hypothetical protein